MRDHLLLRLPPEIIFALTDLVHLMDRVSNTVAGHDLIFADFTRPGTQWLLARPLIRLVL